MSATVVPLVPPEKWAAFAEALIDFQSFPGRYSTVAKEPKVLFEHLTGLLAVAAGRPVDGLPEGEELRSQLQAAARFFVRAAMLRPGTDHYSLMGLAPGFEPAMLREHYRMLMRLTHPDFAAGGEQWPTDAATRINQANDVLGSAERRAVYDQALTAVRTPGGGELALARRPLAPRPVEPDEAKKRWPAVAAAGVSVAVLAFLLWPEKPAHERLASLAQAPGETPQAAPAEAAPTRAMTPTAADAAPVARETRVARATPSAPPAPAPGPAVPSNSTAPAGPMRSSGPAPAKSPVAADSIGGVSKAPGILPAAVGSPPAPAPAALPAASAVSGVVRPSVPVATSAPTPRPVLAASKSTRPAAPPPVVAVAPRPVPEAPSEKAAAVTPVAPAVAVKTGSAGAVVARPAGAASTPLLLAGAPGAGGAPVPGRSPATGGGGASATDAPALLPPRPLAPAPAVAPVVPVPPPAVAGAIAVSPPPVRPAAAEALRPDAPRMADVQPLLAQVLGALQSGRGERALAVIDRAFRPGDGSARFLAAYNRAIAGARDIRVGAVQFRSRNVANSLVVDGTIALQSLDNDGPGLTRDLPVRAVFLSRDGQPVLAQLSSGEP